MQKEFQHPSIPTKISEKIIYDTYCDNYDSIHYLFVEFQFSWLQQAYKALKDIDKYYILIYLYKENFTELNEIFKVKSYEEFYFNPRFELDKINIIQIAKKLRLSKETARRKILELEKDGILIKNKKSIAVTLKAGLLQKPVNTINSFSKILQYVSKLLCDQKIVKKYYEKDFFIKKIKERFTQILAIFLEYQIKYLLIRKEIANNDMEMWFIIGSLLYNQIMFLKKSGKKQHYQKEWIDKVLDVGRILLAAEMLGGIQECFERTVEYLKTREQFGVPIGSFQSLKHRAAQMFCEVELSKSVVLEALSALDEDSDQIPELASLAKARLNDTYNLVSSEGVQMHGGIGMTDEYEIGFFMKRSRVCEHTFGGSAFHRDRYGVLQGY